MSAVRQSNPIVAISCSDIHLSTKPPPIYGTDVDRWHGIQAKYLKQLSDLSLFGNGAAMPAIPVLFAGDLFDKWNAPAELINFALEHLPIVYGIPGQHDLAYHNFGGLKKTAFYTLIRAGRIHMIWPGQPTSLLSGGKAIRVHGFPWGYDIEPNDKPHDMVIEIALVHRYIWVKNHCYPGAPPSNRARAYKSMLSGYDYAFFGDNHKGFDVKLGKCSVSNCGGFIRRKSDELDYRPSVVLLLADGGTERLYFDTSEDQLVPTLAKDLPVDEGAIKTFIQELTHLTDTAINFSDAVRKVLGEGKVNSEVRKIILQAMGEDK